MSYHDSILLAALQADEDDLPLELLPTSIFSWAQAWSPAIALCDMD